MKPDKVTLSLGVETANKTAEAALESNSNLMNKTLLVLKKNRSQRKLDKHRLVRQIITIHNQE